MLAFRRGSRALRMSKARRACLQGPHLLLAVLLVLQGTRLGAGREQLPDGLDSERELHQPIMLFVAGIPLHVVVSPRSDALAVGMEQVTPLLAPDSALARCSRAACTLANSRPDVCSLPPRSRAALTLSHRRWR